MPYLCGFFESSQKHDGALKNIQSQNTKTAKQKSLKDEWRAAKQN